MKYVIIINEVLTMTSEKRIKILHYLGMITLGLLALKFLSDLFGSELSLLFSAINTIVFPLGVALFVSYLLAPIVNIIEKKFKVPYRWLSISIVFIFMGLAFSLFVFLIGDLVYKQAVILFSEDWGKIITYIELLIEDNVELTAIYDNVKEYLSFENLSPFFFNVVGIVKGVTGLLVSVVLIPVFLFFLLHDKSKIFEGIISVIPKKKQFHIRELGKRADVVIEKYFNGKFIMMFLMSILFSIVFYIFGFGIRSLFFGFFLGFLDIVPYVGGFVGMLFPILYSFTVADDLMFAEYTFIAIIIANTIGQFLQGNILQPIIMGREVNLHPLLVLSSFIFFGALFGMTGIILAIPITGIIKISFEYFGELSEKKEIAKTKV
jgi:putative permease